jgi:hypothetical protein
MKTICFEKMKIIKGKIEKSFPTLDNSHPSQIILCLCESRLSILGIHKKKSKERWNDGKSFLHGG